MLFESQLHDLYAILPWVSVRRKKEAMRNIDSQKRRILTPDRIKEDSAKIVERIAQMHHFKDAKTVMVYYPVHNEVDLRGLVQQFEKEKTFLFPAIAHHTHKMEVRRFESHTPFVKGRYGIPEPKTEAYDGPIDMIITPGLCFDKNHWRVGRGGGYYDRFLRRFPGVYKVGVGYDFQLHKEVPHWIFDRRVDRVVTPSQTI